MRLLSATETSALLDVSAALRVYKPETFAALIEFESTWDPRKKNPLSSAEGLIQFMDKTAYEMGFKGPDPNVPWKGASRALVDAYPTVERQLRGPVYTYLKKWAPFDTDQSLFMAVFYPAARRWPLTERFVDHMGSDAAQRFTTQNPGIVTVGDYVRRVWKRVGTVVLA